MRPQGSFPAGPGEPGVEARGTGPRAGPGCGDHRPPPRALRPRLAARPTSRLGGWSLFASPQRRQMRPAVPAARVARPPRWHREPPCCRPPRARSHSTPPPPPPPTRPTRRAGEHDAAKEAEAARSGRPGLEGCATAPPAARGPAWDPRSGRRPRGQQPRERSSGNRAFTPRTRAWSDWNYPGGGRWEWRRGDQEEAGTRAPCRPRAPPVRCLETNSWQWPGSGRDRPWREGFTRACTLPVEMHAERSGTPLVLGSELLTTLWIPGASPSTQH